MWSLRRWAARPRPASGSHGRHDVRTAGAGGRVGACFASALVRSRLALQRLELAPCAGANCCPLGEDDVGDETHKQLLDSAVVECIRPVSDSFIAVPNRQRGAESRPTKSSRLKMCEKRRLAQTGTPLKCNGHAAPRADAGACVTRLARARPRCHRTPSVQPRRLRRPPPPPPPRPLPMPPMPGNPPMPGMPPPPIPPIIL